LQPSLIKIYASFGTHFYPHPTPLSGIEAKQISAGVSTTCVTKALTNIKLHLHLVKVGFGLFVGTPVHVAGRHTSKGIEVEIIIKS